MTKGRKTGERVSRVGWVAPEVDEFAGEWMGRAVEQVVRRLRTGTTVRTRRIRIVQDRRETPEATAKARTELAKS